MDGGVVGQPFEVPYFHLRQRHPPWNDPPKSSVDLAKHTPGDKINISSFVEITRDGTEKSVPWTSLVT